MKQRKMLSFTLYQLGLLFRQELPGLVAQADASRDAGEFRARLEEFVARHAAAQGEAAEQIRLLIGYDGREVSELSTGEQMPVRTLELLWQFLTGRLENPEMRCDLFIDLFFQFKRLEGLELQPLTPQRVRIRSDRWPTGLDPEERIRFRNLLSEVSENDVTIILSTHIVGDISSTCNCMALMNKGEVSFYGSPQDMLRQAEGKVWRIRVTSDELHEVDKLYPVISTIPSGTGWEVQVVADEVQGYDAESYPPNLEHAYVYYMENKLNRWRND